MGQELHEERDDGRGRVRKLDAAGVEGSNQQLSILAGVVLEKRPMLLKLISVAVQSYRTYVPSNLRWF